jgi:hypothetical protein
MIRWSTPRARPKVAQEKIQDIKQSPSTKMGTKPDARSRRNKLGRGDRTRPSQGPDVSDQLPGSNKRQHSDRTHRRYCSLARHAQRWPDAMTKEWLDTPAAASDQLQRGSRVAPAWPNASDHKWPDSAEHPISGARQWLVDRWEATGCVQSGRDQRSVSSKFANFDSNG